jgi:protein involved in sex pheromone biosynthesis
MQIKTIATTVRPNASVPFYTFTEEQRTHFTTVYTNTGKMTRTTEKSPDNLTKIVERTFATEADYEAYKADSVLIAAKTAREAYNQANGHTTSIVVEMI